MGRHGLGMVFPGASRAGKSTLVAALMLAGFDYCSDEVVVLGQDARLRPFPKVVSLKAGGWKRVAREFAEVSQELLSCHSTRAGISYLQPQRLPSESRALSGYPVEFVILPRYAPSKQTALQPISKSVALTQLVEQSLNLPLWGAEGFEALVNLVQHAECWVLTVNSLREAVEVLEGLATQRPSADAIPSLP